MKREMRGRRVSSDERLGMGAKLGRYISIRPLLHTSVISSSISIILLGAMIKTKAQQPHASTDVAPTMGGLWSRPPGCTACGSWPLGNHEETAQNARSQERLEALVLTEFQLVALEKALGFYLATVIHLTQYCHSIYNDGKAARQGSVRPSLMDVMSAIQEWER